MMDKAIAQRVHFTKRMKERYGVTVTTNLYYYIIKLIKEGKAIHKRSQSLRLTVHYVKLKLPNYSDEIIIPIVYDNIRKSLVTALPSENSILTKST